MLIVLIYFGMYVASLRQNRKKKQPSDLTKQCYLVYFNSVGRNQIKYKVRQMSSTWCYINRNE